MGNTFDAFQELFPSPTWNDIRVGVERGFLDVDPVILLAGDYLLTHPDEEVPALLELAIASPGDREAALPSLKWLADREAPDKQSRAIRRWRYLFLQQAIAEARTPEHLFEAVERVYADFDYLSDMYYLIYYHEAPPEFRHLSRDESVARLQHDIYEFVTREGQSLGCT